MMKKIMNFFKKYDRYRLKETNSSCGGVGLYGIEKKTLFGGWKSMPVGKCIPEGFPMYWSWDERKVSMKLYNLRKGIDE